MCLTCGRLGPALLCEPCKGLLRPAPDQYLPGVGVVRAPFRHQGPARLLVHHLKYRGVVTAGRVLAGAMAPRLPSGPVLVPVTRLGWRRLRYGVDPALELARALARLTGAAVAPVLTAPFWGKARAGRVHGFAPRFRSRGIPEDTRVILIDDVVTTGATLIAAAALFPTVEGAITATSSMRAATVSGGHLVASDLDRHPSGPNSSGHEPRFPTRS